VQIMMPGECTDGESPVYMNYILNYQVLSCLTNYILSFTDAFNTSAFTFGFLASPTHLSLLALRASISGTLGLERKTAAKIGETIEVRLLSLTIQVLA